MAADALRVYAAKASLLMLSKHDQCALCRLAEHAMGPAAWLLALAGVLYVLCVNMCCV